VAGEVQARRSLTYIVYDNACMLARFVRNRARVTVLGVLQQLAALVYIIDRYHKSNHRACLNPQHRLYSPEVDIDRYPDLKHLNTSLNEQWNSWLDIFAPTARHMHPVSFQIYILLLADLWNVHVACKNQCRPVLRAPAPKRGLKREKSKSSAQG
jgi:hypothetical protein